MGDSMDAWPKDDNYEGYDRRRDDRGDRGDRGDRDRDRERERSPPRRPRAEGGRGGGGPRRRLVPPPSENDQPGRHVAVFKLSMHTTEEALQEYFSQVGELESCSLVMDRSTGRSRGFGFLTFKEEEHAIAAVRTLHDSVLDGRNLKVVYSKTHGPHDPTPGKYMGHKDQQRSYRYTDRGDRYEDHYDDDRHSSRRYDNRDRDRDSRRRYDGDDRYSSRRDDRYSSQREYDRRPPPEDDGYRRSSSRRDYDDRY